MPMTPATANKTAITDTAILCCLMLEMRYSALDAWVVVRGSGWCEVVCALDIAPPVVVTPDSDCEGVVLSIVAALFNSRRTSFSSMATSLIV